MVVHRLLLLHTPGQKGVIHSAFTLSHHCPNRTCIDILTLVYMGLHSDPHSKACQLDVCSWMGIRFRLCRQVPPGVSCCCLFCCLMLELYVDSCSPCGTA